MKKIFAFIFSASLLFTFSCGDDETTGGTSDTVEALSSTAIDSVTDSLRELTTSSNSGDICRNIFVPDSLNVRPDLKERLYSFVKSVELSSPAYGAEFTYSYPLLFDGSITVSNYDRWYTSDTSFYILKTFNDWKFKYGAFNLTGKSLLKWSGLGTSTTPANKIVQYTKIEQAPIERRFTNTANERYITVTGTGSAITDGTNSGNVAHSIEWTNALSSNPRTYELSISLTREGFTSAGETLFRHSVSTSSAVGISSEKLSNDHWKRTINGTVWVKYELANVTLEATFSNVVIYSTQTFPSSGTIVIHLTGATTGSGEITFNSTNYSAAYEYNDGTKTYTGVISHL